MTVFIILTSIFMLTVTPFRISLRGIFNSIRMYSVANVTIFRFLLAFKFRFKIKDKKIYYSVNNKNIRTLGEKKIEKSNRRNAKIFDTVFIDNVNIKVKYGVKDDAMRTALETSAIYNLLMMISKFLKVGKFEIEVNSEFNNELIAVDLDIESRITVFQIIAILIRILKERIKYGKHRKHNAGNTV